MASMPRGATRTRRVAMRTRAPAPIAALACVLALGACGATPPQLPGPEANRVAAALAGIAQACGQARQRASSRVPVRASIEAAARMRARQLADVLPGNARRIYQSETMRQVVAEAGRYLRECALAGVASQLSRAISTPPRRASSG